MIFEDFSRFILVENIFEEVVLHSVMKDIMMGQFSSLFLCGEAELLRNTLSVCVCLCVCV